MQWPFRRPKIPFVVPIFSRGHAKPHRGPSYGTGRGISTEKTWVAECRDILAYSHPHGNQPLGMATVTPFHEGNTVAQSHVWNDLLDRSYKVILENTAAKSLNTIQCSDLIWVTSKEERSLEAVSPTAESTWCLLCSECLCPLQISMLKT